MIRRTVDAVLMSLSVEVVVRYTIYIYRKRNSKCNERISRKGNLHIINPFSLKIDLTICCPLGMNPHAQNFVDKYYQSGERALFTF